MRLTTEWYIDYSKNEDLTIVTDKQIREFFEKVDGDINE
jgi:hypothetical protein